MKLLIIILFLTSGCSLVYGPPTEKVITDVVIKKSERVCTGGETGSCKYMVFTNKGSFDNTDSLYGFKFNSADFHGDLITGNVCTLTVIGFRNELLSIYPNIIKLKCEEKK